VARPRLLAVGQALNASGYARVMESLLTRLSGAFDAVLLAPNHHGRTVRRRFEVRGSAMLGDPYGREQLPGVLDEVRPDAVLVQVDAAHFAIHAPALAAYRARRPGARLVAYCPVDWPELPPQVPRALAGFDAVAAYTEYGRRVLRRAFAEAGVAAPPLAVVPHGVDTLRFAPLDRAAARERLLGPGHEHLFLVLNANRNIRRKRVDLTLAAFARFARDRPGARLYLHMGARDGGCDVPALAAELGIADRVLLAPAQGRRPRVPDDELNLVYNACDVGVNTCAAEGWGLVAFEHAATGAAQVVPDHSACAELWRDRALLVPAGPGGAVAPGDVAAALARLHDDQGLRADLAARARAHARSQRFAWETVAVRFGELLAPTPAGRPPPSPHAAAARARA
jgi:D-inositol-3-phosphate glycosyltransferase